MNRGELLRMSGLPVYQNKMYPSAQAALACPRGDLVLVQDATTGLIHNRAFDPMLLDYDQSYQNEQGHSAVFKAHLDDVLALIDEHFTGATILEVGCGKGAFVELMRARGHAATGIDPAYEGEARHIVRAHFNPDAGISAQAVVMRHTLEHIADPLAFLDLVRTSNGNGGLIYIEVPCLDWIIAHRAWFDIFYEHVNYFRLDDFHRIFDKVLDCGRLFGGQYLYVIADMASLRPAAALAAVAPLSIPADLFCDVDSSLARARGGGRRIVWGAAAKGMMFAHHAAQRGMALDFAIDINPAKQSQYLAGTGLAVLAPGQGLSRLADGDYVFVMNSNYLGEITCVGGERLHYISVDSQ